jgi:hypothetical protein
VPFWRRKALHERLAEEGTLPAAEPMTAADPRASDTADAGSAEPGDASEAALPDPRALEERFFGEQSIPLFERLSGEVTAPRPRRWDAVATVDAPGLPGTELEFVALPDGTLLRDDDVDVAAAEPLAEAVERTVDPPYRAEAVRRSGDVWGVAARRVEVAELPTDVPGDHVTVSLQDGERTVVVDGEEAFGSQPALERLGAERFPDGYVVEARRLDDTLWEVRVSPL